MFDIERLIRRTSLDHIEYHETLESTNKLAVELGSELLALTPALVLTTNQTAGRGRGTNTWQTTGGALTFSLVLNTDELRLSPQRISLVSLAAGAAVRNSLKVLLPSHDVKVKWPNDVLVGERKICGILTEQHQGTQGAFCVIGVGVNANNSIAASQTEFRMGATSLFDLTSSSHNLTDVLVAVLNEIDQQLERLASRPREFFAELNTHSLLNGKMVTVNDGPHRHQGICRGIDDSGCLVLEHSGIAKRIIAGSVQAWS